MGDVSEADGKNERNPPVQFVHS